MSQWQLFKTVKNEHKSVGDDGKETVTVTYTDVAQAETFDDGIWAGPGEDGFTTEHVEVEAKHRKCKSWSYIGRTTQVSERTEADITPRVDEHHGALRGELTDKLFAAKVAEIPEGEQRFKHEVDAEVAAEVDTHDEKLRGAARKAVLRDMGLRDVPS